MTRTTVKLAIEVVVALVAQSFLLAPLPAEETNRASKDVAALSQRGIEPTSASVAAYLRSLRPDPTADAKSAELIAKLGHASFAIRSAATRGLIELPIVPIERLRAAAESPDSETAIRAKQILSHAKTLAKLEAASRQRDLAAAVLRTIAARPVAGTTTVLLDVAPSLKDAELVQLAGDATAQVANKDDLPAIRSALASESVPTRIVAVRALGKAGGNGALAELHALTRDKDDRVRFAVAQSLAEQGDRNCLPLLIHALESKDTATRVRAEQTLRAATKENFGFNPFAKVAEQQSQLDRWKKWLAEQGDAVNLQVPLVLEMLPEDLGHGLIAHYTFDDTNAGRLADAGGSGRVMTAANAVAFVVRGKGHAIEFTGANHHGADGGHAILPAIDFAKLDEFTLALWVKETGLVHEEGEAYITYGIDRGVSTEDALGIAHFNGNLIFRTGDGQIDVPYQAANRGRWVHFAMTFEMGRLMAYRNGEKRGESAARVKVQGTDAALARHWWAGGGGTSTRFQGAMDEIRVYSRALSGEQIRCLVEQTSE